jgi:hypothetical protein
VAQPTATPQRRRRRNGGGRAPTTVRLPAGHGGEENSSPELLVDSEGKKSGSAAAFFRRGGATVAGDSPTTVRREGKVSSTLHGRRTARGELGRRSPWTKLAMASDDRTAAGFKHGGGVASDSGDVAVGTGRGEADSGGGAARGCHAATARCQEGPTQTAASDRWDPLVSVF